MFSLAESFRRLKTRLPGNRERGIYEWQYGVKPEAVLGIHGPSVHAERLLGQLEFAIRLSAGLGGRFDAEIKEALAVAEAGVLLDGDITSALLVRVESLLMPLSYEAKQYTVLCVAHAHIDMNWLWGYPETVAITLNTFETMLRFMDEYPDFTFSQSQGAVYEIVERFAPEMKSRIQQRIQEGRWEVTASSWVEQDKNMPDVESMARHLLYTKSYLNKNWGVEPDSIALDFSPDTFGHCGNMPEILNQCGVSFYYHCRGYEGPHYLYRWRSPSGAEVIAYREGMFYIGTITPQLGATAYALAQETGLRTSLCVYGVGDHGGGPTRRDIERIIDQNKWPIFPQFRFGRYSEYFQLAETLRESLPVVDHPLNFHAPGCYTTQSRLKRINKQTEAALLDAEALSAVAFVNCQHAYRANAFMDAWRKVLFSHFHDILTGSCIRDAQEHAMGLYQDAQATAMTEMAQAMRTIASHVHTTNAIIQGSGQDTAEGAGVGYGVDKNLVSVSGSAGGSVRIYHVFNPLPFTRNEVVELPVWDWEDDLRQFAVQDTATGELCDCQLLDAQKKTYWVHQVVRVLARVCLPPLGYTTVSLFRKQDVTYPLTGINWTPVAPEWDRNIVLENDLIRAVFSSHDATLVSLVDKDTGQERLHHAGFRLIQEDLAMATAWVVGRQGTVKELCDSVRIYDVQTGERDAAYQLEMLRNFGEPPVVAENLRKTPLRQMFTFELPITERSSMTCNVSLDKGKAELVYNTTIHWGDMADAKTKSVPQLSFAVKPCYNVTGYAYDTPGGEILLADRDGDVPGLTYGVALAENERAIYLTSDAKYGYRGAQGTLSLTLLRSPAHPDPYSDQGVHNIRFALGIGDAKNNYIRKQAKSFAHSSSVLSGCLQEGDLPPSNSFLSLEDEDSLTLAAVKCAEDRRGIVLRLFADPRREGSGTIHFTQAIRSAKFVDILERSSYTTGQLFVEGHTLRIALPNGCLASVYIMFEEENA